jgi:hypothetical protein
MNLGLEAHSLAGEVCGDKKNRRRKRPGMPQASNKKKPWQILMNKMTIQIIFVCSRTSRKNRPWRVLRVYSTHGQKSEDLSLITVPGAILRGELLLNIPSLMDNRGM